MRARALDRVQTESVFQTGYYGKIPGRGDFVHHCLSREFIDPWDAWLQISIASSRNRLMDQWLDTYLTSPLWRYYLSPGLCGQHGWAGVMMPSVDKVGRYFPLTMACSLPAKFNPFNLMSDQAQWFVETEALMLSLLDEQRPDLDEFERKVEQLSGHFDEHKSRYHAEKKSPGILGLGPLWRLPLADVDAAVLTCSELSRQMLAARFSTYSLWWSEGSEQVTPSFLVSSGLPSADSFSSLMNGLWVEAGWEEWPLSSSFSIPSSPSSIAIQEENPECSLNDNLEALLIYGDNLVKNQQAKSLFNYHSSAISHEGKVRLTNEDACLDLPEQGLWVVADGMGGHTAGQLASSMTVDDLSYIERPDTLNEFVDNVKQRLQSVHQKLLVRAQEQAVSIIGCTVVVLMILEQRAAFVWAGDSRVYLSRDNELQQLTKDHSYEAMAQFAHEGVNVGKNNQLSNIVTRAVGANSELELDVGYMELKEGDRFLLCSDGLNKEMEDCEIAKLMQGDNTLEITQQLIELSLARGAQDNVTVITVGLSTAEIARS